MKKMLINALDSEESRMAIVEDGLLAELVIESSLQELTRGNIYKGKIINVEPGLQAAFVDYGASRHGFLPWAEIHPDYYAPEKKESYPGARLPIAELIKPYQEVLVQVEKEETGNKGAALTTYISLPGRYLVLMPGSNGGGISRKIEDEKERRKIKEIIQQLEVPSGMGLIVRTAGLGRNKSELNKDLQYLLRLWKTILLEAQRSPAPSLIYRERDLVIRALRDYFSPDIEEVLIDQKDFFNRARDFMRTFMPRYQNRIKFYSDKRPLFSKYDLEKQIETIYERKVSLKSGGSIVIDPTEALVAIDVNSGRGAQSPSMEDTAFHTNLEATHEIARQLRLRDLGGLIVIDFIDMRDRRHRQEVEKNMRHALKRDKAHVEMGRISSFGLLELSRQRLRPAISERLFIPCRHCQGTGLEKSTEAAALSALRRIQTVLAKGDCSSLRMELPDEVATYLLNQKRSSLLYLEKLFGLKIEIVGRADLLSHQYNLTFSRRELPGGKGEIPKPSGSPEPPSSPERDRKVSLEDADRLAIEELKKETKESFLKKLFWPPSFWKSSR